MHGEAMSPICHRISTILCFVGGCSAWQCVYTILVPITIGLAVRAMCQGRKQFNSWNVNPESSRIHGSLTLTKKPYPVCKRKQKQNKIAFISLLFTLNEGRVRKYTSGEKDTFQISFVF